MKIERVDDIPLLIAEFQKCGLAEKIDQYFPDHGNWIGPSGGKVTIGFLTYILSCADHRLSHVEPWATGRLHVLGHCLEEPALEPIHFSDDRLGSLLDRFSDTEQWDQFEAGLNQCLIRVHELTLEEEAIRLDAFIAQSFRPEGELFQMGYSKQHRSDLPQLKAMVATIDPLAMPIAVLIVSGEKADDPLYMPVIDKVKKTFPQPGLFFVGDAKLSSLSTRSQLQQQGHYYLAPLSKTQCTPEQLVQYLEQRPPALEQLFKDDKSKEIQAQAFELQEIVFDPELDLEWIERRIVVHSTAWANTQQEKFYARLDKAQAALQEILMRKQRKKVPKTLADVQLKVKQVLQKYKVTPFFDVAIEQLSVQIPVRKYGNRPARMKEEQQFFLHVQRNEVAIEQHQQTLGWRVYATNMPKKKLSPTQAVLCYRQEYRIEYKFNQLLNKVTALMPIFLKKPARVEALTKLLLLALKFVSLIQYQVRTELKQSGQYLKELFPGNPGRKTAQPTAEMLLRAFRDISLVILPVNDTFSVQVEKLKPVQLKILSFLKIPPEVYFDLKRISFFNQNFIET